MNTSNNQGVFNYPQSRFSKDEAALLLVGQQAGIMQRVHGYNGPIIGELLEMHPQAPVVDNEAFVAAAKATGRKNLMLAGVTKVQAK